MLTVRTGSSTALCCKQSSLTQVNSLGCIDGFQSQRTYACKPQKHLYKFWSTLFSPMANSSVAGSQSHQVGKRTCAVQLYEISATEHRSRFSPANAQITVTPFQCQNISMNHLCKAISEQINVRSLQSRQLCNCKPRRFLPQIYIAQSRTSSEPHLLIDPHSDRNLAP